jgi:hypothetical protein
MKEIVLGQNGINTGRKTTDVINNDNNFLEKNEVKIKMLMIAEQKLIAP